MECWLKSSMEEQGWGHQAAETDNSLVPGTSLTTIISRSHVQPPASPPLHTQTRLGQRSWTWPDGPQEDVYSVWDMIRHLFSRRPRLRQNYASLSSSPLCSLDTVHQHSSLLAPSKSCNRYISKWQHYSGKRIHGKAQQKSNSASTSRPYAKSVTNFQNMIKNYKQCIGKYLRVK